MRNVPRFLIDDHATTSVEYAVMLALIFSAIISAVMAFGGNTGTLFGRSSQNLTEHGFGS
jgi:Flp pilus assembly pilin Flp